MYKKATEMAQREGSLTGSMGGKLPGAGDTSWTDTQRRARRWRWGKKKGLRRARRREGLARIRQEFEGA